MKLLHAFAAGTLAVTSVLFFQSCDSTKVPEVTTLSVNDVTNKSAVVAVSVTEDGGSEVISRGVCYSTLPDPNVNNEQVVVGQGTGSFEATLAGLETDRPAT